MITLQYLTGSFLTSIYIHFIPNYVREKCELVVGGGGDYFLNSKTIRTVFLLVQKAASIDTVV
jgi:hypothetical protein